MAEHPPDGTSTDGTGSIDTDGTDPAATPSGLAGVPLYGLDIETDTAVDGLDPSRSAVVAVAFWGGPVGTPDERAGGHVEEVVEAPGTEPDDERALLTRVDRLLADLPPGVIVTWNGRRFDLPFIDERARRLGVATGLRIDPVSGEAQWHRHRHLDGLRAYRADVGRTLGLSCALKPLSRFVGLDPVEVDRTRIHELDDATLRAYVLSDARLAHELVARRWPALAGWVDRTVSTGSPGPATVSTGSPDPATVSTGSPGPATAPLAAPTT